MKVLIVGAGAVGGFVGARLLQAGADVVFLVRDRRLRELSERGLVVESPLGNFSRTVKAVRAAPSDFSPHLIVIACKAPALNSALEAVAPSVGPDTHLLPLLNGIAHLESLRTAFSGNDVLGGLVHGALTLREDGVIGHLSPFFSAIVGYLAPNDSRLAEELVALLRAANVEANVSPNIRQDMWNKFVFLTTLAGITCLMRAPVGTIVSTDHGQDLTLKLLREALSVAQAEGFPPDSAAMDSYTRLLTDKTSTLTASMLRDVLAGKSTEADHIIGDMLRIAQRHRLETPMLEVSMTHLRCHEASIRGTVGSQVSGSPVTT